MVVLKKRLKTVTTLMILASRGACLFLHIKKINLNNNLKKNSAKCLCNRERPGELIRCSVS